MNKLAHYAKYQNSSIAASTESTTSHSVRPRKKTTDIYIMQLWTQPIFDAETSILSHDGRRLV